jgi:hypothetical protein
VSATEPMRCRVRVEPTADGANAVSGRVRSAGVRQARHQALADRIGHLHEHDRHGVALLLESDRHRRAVGQDQVRRHAKQVPRVAAQQISVARGPAVRVLVVVFCPDGVAALGFSLGERGPGRTFRRAKGRVIVLLPKNRTARRLGVWAAWSNANYKYPSCRRRHSE